MASEAARGREAANGREAAVREAREREASTPHRRLQRGGGLGEGEAARASAAAPAPASRFFF